MVLEKHTHHARHLSSRSNYSFNYNSTFQPESTLNTALCWSEGVALSEDALLKK